MTLRTDGLAGAALIGLPALELMSGDFSAVWIDAGLSALGLLVLACIAALALQINRRTA